MSAGSHYTDEQRREAVAQYVVLGNWRKVAEATGIPQRPLGDWSKQPWFHTLLAEVRAEKGAELDGQLTRIIHKATDQLLDRLDNGDAVLVGGEIKRKPVSARDLAMVAAIVYDKRALLRDDPTTIVRAPFDAAATIARLEQYARNPEAIWGCRYWRGRTFVASSTSGPVERRARRHSTTGRVAAADSDHTLPRVPES